MLQMVPCHKWSPRTIHGNFIAIDGPPGPSVAAIDGPHSPQVVPPVFSVLQGTSGVIPVSLSHYRDLLEGKACNAGSKILSSHTNNLNRCRKNLRQLEAARWLDPLARCKLGRWQRSHTAGAWNSLCIKLVLSVACMKVFNKSIRFCDCKSCCNVVMHAGLLIISVKIFISY